MFNRLKLIYLVLIPMTYLGMAEESYGPIISIDLGTTYSCVGIVKDGRVEIIPNELGNRMTPSYVAFTSDGERLIGDAAKDQLPLNPENTVFDAMRLIGREFKDSFVQDDMKYWPFKVVDKNSKPHIKIDNGAYSNKLFAPEEITAMILGKMKDIAENYLGEKVTHAVITVPFYFDNDQLEAIYDAASIAGLKVILLLNKATAAVKAYDFDKKDGAKNIIVFDLGGRTFEISLFINENLFKLMSKSYNVFGGSEFDNRIMEYFIEIYQNKTGKNLRDKKSALFRLKHQVERAKVTLSTQLTTQIEIESFFDGENFSETLTRALFEELNIDIFQYTLEQIQILLDFTGLEKTEIDEIVLVGGSSQIPKMQQLVKEFFDGKEPNRSINPDEVVAYGAAIQASDLPIEKVDENFILLDVFPFSFAVETSGSQFTSLVYSTDIFIGSISSSFTTIPDNQQTSTIKLFNNKQLMGKFNLTGIAPALRGVQEIEVTFDIYINGLVRVTAKEIDYNTNRVSKEETINEIESFKTPNDNSLNEL